LILAISEKSPSNADFRETRRKFGKIFKTRLVPYLSATISATRKQTRFLDRAQKPLERQLDRTNSEKWPIEREAYTG
jgi:hypothetical protein